MAVSGMANTVESVATLYLLCIERPTPPPTAFCLTTVLRHSVDRGSYVLVMPFSKAICGLG